MSQNPNPGPVQPPQSHRDALLLALIAFVLGIVLAGAWFHHHYQSATKKSHSILFPVTKELMGDLTVPVSVDYYSLLPSSSADKSLQSFAGRVSKLLVALKTASHGKLQVTRIDTPSETNTATASASGIQAFNLDKGGACFLGVVLSSGNSKQVFARLQPKWEPVLQFDLARAISHVAAENAPTASAIRAAKPSPETIAAIHRLIPDLSTTSTEQGDQMLHEQFLKDCSQTGKETAAKLKAAEQEVTKAQASGSQADVEAARKKLLQVQLDGANQIKNLAAQLQTQLAAFKKMKEHATNADQ